MKKTSSAQIVAKKIVQKYKNLLWEKVPIRFNITGIADAATVDYNNDTDINDLMDNTPSKNKNAQIVAKKIAKKYRNLARKKPYQRPAKK